MRRRIMIPFFISDGDAHIKAFHKYPGVAASIEKGSADVHYMWTELHRNFTASMAKSVYGCLRENSMFSPPAPPQSVHWPHFWTASSADYIALFVTVYVSDTGHFVHIAPLFTITRASLLPEVVVQDFKTFPCELWLQIGCQTFISMVCMASWLGVCIQGTVKAFAYPSALFLHMVFLYVGLFWTAFSFCLVW